MTNTPPPFPGPQTPPQGQQPQYFDQAPPQQYFQQPPPQQYAQQAPFQQYPQQPPLQHPQQVAQYQTPGPYPVQQYARPYAPVKDTAVAYLLWFFLGALGIHRFYLRQTGLGILYLLTGGILGIGILVDLFAIPSAVRRANYEISVGIR